MRTERCLSRATTARETTRLSVLRQTAGFSFQQPCFTENKPYWHLPQPARLSFAPRGQDTKLKRKTLLQMQMTNKEKKED